jgi:hypothetical protein
MANEQRDNAPGVQGAKSVQHFLAVHKMSLVVASLARRSRWRRGDGISRQAEGVGKDILLQSIVKFLNYI